MNRYKLKINYHNRYGNFKKGLILYHTGSYYKSKCGKLLLYEDYVHSNLDIFEKMEPYKLTLEMNKWYHYNGGYFCLQKEIISGEIMRYGFTSTKHWRYESQFNSKESELCYWKLADMKEVEKLLLNEAKKRYPISTKHKQIFYGTPYTFTISTNFYISYDINNNIHLKEEGGLTLFVNGKWVKTPKK